MANKKIVKIILIGVFIFSVISLVYLISASAYSGDSCNANSRNINFLSSSKKCFDSDSGLNFLVNGYVSFKKKTYNDFCFYNATLSNWFLNEYSCNVRGKLELTSVVCTFGCENGTCLTGSVGCSTIYAPVCCNVNETIIIASNDCVCSNYYNGIVEDSNSCNMDDGLT